jgi:cytochrome c peroxidase
MTPEKIELGKMLYFDTRLSRDNTISCATCHFQKLAWAERRSTSEGVGGQVGQRNSPTVVNTAYLPALFWDGRAGSLEEQALGPIENPIEMGQDLGILVERLGKVSEYRKRFKEAFGTGVTREGIAQAIATFERTILSGNSPYDRYKAGDKSALSDSQKRGLKLFMGKASCALCHTPPLFSNGRFYNAGVDSKKDQPDAGRKTVTGKDRDMGKFRVPMLRDIASTAPYFHDGSARTLAEAVELMAGGGRDNANLSPLLKDIRDEKLTAQDKKDLVEFLKALSGEFPIVEAPKLP